MEPTANLNMLTMIQQGWLATYPLIFMSIVSLTVIAERLWSLRNIVGQTAKLTRGVHQDLTRGDLGAALERAEADRGVPAGRVFSEVVRHGGTKTSDELADLGAERRFEELEQMKRPLWLLGTVASSAPFIGLFGTVIGIIRPSIVWRSTGAADSRSSPAAFRRRWWRPHSASASPSSR